MTINASLEALASMHPHLTSVEFDFQPHEYREGTITGWANEDGRIDHVPDGWHVYSVTDTDDENAFDPIAIVDHGAWVNHRFDFATEANLDQYIADGSLADCDDWGFTRTPIIEAIKYESKERVEN